MSKKDFLAEVAFNLSVSKNEAKHIVSSVFGVASEYLREHGELQITDLGRFQIVNTAPRNGRNPATGESIKIPAKRKLTFKTSSVFKSLL